jgi:hypothetical protein
LTSHPSCVIEKENATAECASAILRPSLSVQRSADLSWNRQHAGSPQIWCIIWAFVFAAITFWAKGQHDRSLTQPYNTPNLWTYYVKRNELSRISVFYLWTVTNIRCNLQSHSSCYGFISVTLSSVLTVSMLNKDYNNATEQAK